MTILDYPYLGNGARKEAVADPGIVGMGNDVTCLLPPPPFFLPTPTFLSLTCLHRILVLRGRSEVQLGMGERCKPSRQMLSYAF